MLMMRKWSHSRFLFLVLFLLLVPSMIVFARDVRQGVECLIDEDEVVTGNLFVLCEDLTIDGEVTGNVIGAALRARVDGNVGGSIYLVSSELNLNGTVAGDVHFGGVALNWNAAPVQISDEDVFLTSNLIALDISTTVAKDANLPGGIINLGYQLIINGNVRDEVNFWGSTLNVMGNINSDVYAHVGDSSADSNSVATLLLPFNLDLTLAEPGLYVDAEASISGVLQYESPSVGTIAGDIGVDTIYNAVQPVALPSLEEPGSFSVFARSTIQEGTALFVMGAICLLLFPQSLRTPLLYMRYHPFASVSVGLLSFIISFPVILITFLLSLVIVVLMLWLGLQAVAAMVAVTLSVLILGGALTFYLVAIFVARALFALALGRFILRLVWSREAANVNAYVALFVGTIILSIIVTLPVIGWVANALALFLGLGGILHVLLERFRNMRGDTPETIDEPDSDTVGPTISVESLPRVNAADTEPKRPITSTKAPTQPRKLDVPPSPGMKDLPEGFDIGFFDDK